jgi:PAS domain S-box-containing protein
MIGRHVTDFIFKEDLPAFEERMYKRMGGNGEIYEQRWRHAESSAVFCRVSATPITDDEGKFGGSFAMFTDITERKSAEEKVARLAAIVESSDDAIIGKTLDGIVTSWNNGAKIIYGYTESEMVGKSISTLIPLERAEEVSLILEKIKQGEHFEHCETVRQRKDGQFINVSLTISPVLDAGGKIIGASTVGRDITERKQTEVTLQALSSRQIAILSAVPDIIAEVDNNKVYTWMNQAGLRFFGEDVIGKEAADFFIDEQKIYQMVQPLFKGDENVIYVESWQRRRDGAKRLLAWWCRVLKDATGNVVGAISSAHDITEHKLAEEALRESEERYRTLVENTGEGIGIVDLEDRFIFANQAADEIFGAPKGSLIGHSLSEFVDPMQLEDVSKKIYARQPGQASIYPLDILRPDGSQRTLNITSSTRFDAQDKPIGSFGIFSDITERKRTEEALRESEEKFRVLFESAQDGIFLLSSDGNIKELNESFARMHGYTIKEMLKMNLRDIDAPESACLAPERFKRLLAGESLSFDVEHYCREYRQIWSLSETRSMFWGFIVTLPSGSNRRMK